MEDGEGGEAHGETKDLRRERTGTNSTLVQVWVKCVGNESMLAAESVTNSGSVPESPFLAAL